MKYTSVNSNWYCWVPTNLGTLSYDFITHKQIKEVFGSQAKYSPRFSCKAFYDLDLKFIIDSLPSHMTSTDLSEEIPTGVISIANTSSNMEGRLLFEYRDTFRIIFNYKVQPCGKTSIFNAKYTIKDINLELPKNHNDSLFDTFAQIAYMMIKHAIHGDNHHHQKIDYVLKVQRNNFSVSNVIDTFGKHIKNVERDIKSIDRCRGNLKALNSVEEVRGYISYVDTFYALYKAHLPKTDTAHIKVKNMNNVLISLEATVRKKDNHIKYMDNPKTAFLTVVALIISLSLISLNLYIQSKSEEKAIVCSITQDLSILECNKLQVNELNPSIVHDIIYLYKWNIDNVFTVMLLSIFVLFFLLKKCYIGSWYFYDSYNTYEKYKYLSWLRIKDSSFKHILIKLILPLSLIAISLYSLTNNT